jgi:hypothetical protein
LEKPGKAFCIFAEASDPFLSQIYSDAWTVGAPGLHKPLQKLAATWIGVFPPHVLRAVHASVSVNNAPRQQLVDSSQRKPMVKDPRLGSDVLGGIAGQENIAVGDILSALAASGTLNAVFSRSQGTVPSTSLHSSETTKSLELKSDLIKVFIVKCKLSGFFVLVLLFYIEIHIVLVSGQSLILSFFPRLPKKEKERHTIHTFESPRADGCVSLHRLD